nr:hypothetical protein [Actinomadura mexicana]
MDDRSEIAYVETGIRPITTDAPADLSVLAKTLIVLRAQALTEQMSREVMRKVIQKNGPDSSPMAEEHPQRFQRR